MGPLSALTIDAVQAEVLRSYLKHGPHSMLNPELEWGPRLACLTEELGEVAHELTYDTPSSKDDLIKELLQVAAMALSWIDALENPSSYHDLRNRNEDAALGAYDGAPGHG